MRLHSGPIRLVGEHHVKLHLHDNAARIYGIEPPAVSVGAVRPVSRKFLM